MAEDFYHTQCGQPLQTAAHVFVWGHGWGQSSAAFAKLCAALPHHAHILLDFPGFGRSAPPPWDWGTKDYARAVFEKISALAPDRKIIWVGHSFGGRVGLQLAAHHPEILAAMCLIAGAGLPRPRGLWEALRVKTKIKAFKAARFLAGSWPFFEGIKDRLGSADYKNAGALRGIFVRVVNENLAQEARAITAPVLLIYGRQDQETPPVIGEKLHRLIKDSSLVLLDGFDHYSILNQGRHLVIKNLKQFMDRL
ncbi:MAG: alpha/beta fold hydrolase [Alphaproteobacteria bacterium]|nr:alpha/beta fold hydrolase [Alphaproteobacteria bacterium]